MSKTLNCAACWSSYAWFIFIIKHLMCRRDVNYTRDGVASLHASFGYFPYVISLRAQSMCPNQYIFWLKSFNKYTECLNFKMSFCWKIIIVWIYWRFCKVGFLVVHSEGCRFICEVGVLARTSNRRQNGGNCLRWRRQIPHRIITLGNYSSARRNSFPRMLRFVN